MAGPVIQTRRRLLAGIAAAPMAAVAGPLAAGDAGEAVISRVPRPRGMAPLRGEVDYRERPTPGAERLGVRVGGRRRVYHLFAPGGTSAPRPVIVLLHGAGRGGPSMIEMFAGVAEAHGTALVALDSAGQSWSPRDDAPEVLFAALRHAAARVPLDADRVHLFGHSAGARLATLYANHVPGPWRSAATHGGVLDAALVIPAPDGPPILSLLGTRDHLFPVPAAQATARALAVAGHPNELRLIEEHTHWFYRIGPWLAEQAWAFMDAAPPRGG